jgi:hypothetical protein
VILILDTEFTDLTPDKELLSLALTSADGGLEFYGERNDVPVEHCSQFVRSEVLPLMTAQPPVAGDFLHLRARLLAFINELPEKGTLACDSYIDFDLFNWVVGRPWPQRLNGNRLNLAELTSLPVFLEAQARYHEEGHPYHHALNDVRGLRAGYQAWLRKPG